MHSGAILALKMDTEMVKKKASGRHSVFVGGGGAATLATTLLATSVDWPCCLVTFCWSVCYVIRLYTVLVSVKFHTENVWLSYVTTWILSLTDFLCAVCLVINRKMLLVGAVGHDTAVWSQSRVFLPGARPVGSDGSRRAVAAGRRHGHCTEHARSNTEVRSLFSDLFVLIFSMLFSDSDLCTDVNFMYGFEIRKK